MNSIKDAVRAQNLELFIKSRRKEAENYIASLKPQDHELKTRKNVKENFAYALMLGVEEAAEK
jgi:hypothetical protein